MATIDDLRESVLELPGTSEGTHFRLPSYQVGGKNFVGVQKDGRITFALDPSQVTDIVAHDPTVFAEIRRSDKPIGVSVDVARIDRTRLRELVERSWRYVAPKQLVSARDAESNNR